METDNIIFTKSNLHLLPAQLADDLSKAQPEIGDDSSASRSTAGAAQEDVLGCKVVPNGTNAGADLGVDSEKSTVDGSEDSENVQEPIAVFRHARKAQVGCFLQFDGYYRIYKLAFLAPKSPELVKMLQKKSAKTDRFGNGRSQQRGE